MCSCNEFGTVLFFLLYLLSTVFFHSFVFLNRYGVNIAIADADGGKTKLNVSQGHKFFVTRHGVRENLYEEAKPGVDDTDLQMRFEIQKPNQQLIIPKTAAPLTGDRLKKNKCVDRYAMCKREGGLRQETTKHQLLRVLL